MLRKLNNKGNTLVIVIIGIFVLSILGTLILGVTATNLSMKSNENKNEKTFYYAEKATDELYAGIGNEVMNAIQESYKEVLENYVNYTNSHINPNTKLVALLNGRLIQLYDNKRFNAANDVDKMLDRFTTNNYVKAVNGYTFDYKYNKDKIEVKFYKKIAGTTDYEELNASDSASTIAKITINNVGVKCTSTQGHSSAIITDFDIKIPDFNIDFSDSATGMDLSSLLKYSLICQGGNLSVDLVNANDRTSPALVIGNGAASSKVTISGNVYADGTAYKATAKTYNGTGKYYVNDSIEESKIVSKNSSIKVSDNAELTMNSKIINCNNDIEVGSDASFTARNRNGVEATDTTDTLQLFANNIITKAGTNKSTINISGNIMVKDDLQIDGDETKVTLKGNYFGYGFRDNGSGTEADSTAITGFVAGSATTTEHEKSSAIVINGKKADIDMEGVKNLVLAGRAYIDLDASGNNTSYMTGESISFKGNQSLYLADDSLLGGSVISSNPISYSQISSMLGTDGDISYIQLGLDNPDSVVAKKIKGSKTNGDLVYFYVRNNTPSVQTQYFMNQCANSQTMKKLQEQVKELEVRQVKLSNSLKAYSVGALMRVKKLGNDIPGEITNPTSGELGITHDNTLKLIKVIKNRIENLNPTLNDISESHIMGADDSSDYTEETASTKNELTFDYLVDREKLNSTCNGGRVTKEISLQDVSATDSTLSDNGLNSAQQKEFKTKAREIIDREIPGFNYTTQKFGYLLSCEGGKSNSALTLDAGVIITDSPCYIEKDFTGLIICNGTVNIVGNISVKASEELGQLLFDNCPKLRSVLGAAFELTGLDEDNNVVDVSNIKYTDIIDKSNWQKDNNN